MSVRTSEKHKAQVYRMFLIYCDKIVFKQTPIEQSLYLQLFRLTYAIGSREVEISQNDISNALNIKSPITIRRAVNGLIRKHHIKIIRRDYKLKTKYYVYTPLQIITSDKKTNRRKWRRGKNRSSQEKIVIPAKAGIYS